MKKYYKEILMGVLVAIIITGAILWFSKHEPEAILKIIIAAALSIILLGIYLARLIKKRREIKLNIPVEDEMTLKLKVAAGNRAFHLSIYLWLFIFIFNSHFSDNEEMLGVGIIGSAIIYGLCIWHFKTSGNFNEKQD